MEAKYFLHSKTLWFNAFSIGLLILQYISGRHWIAGDTAALGLGLINLGLRTITSQPLTVSK